jgi:cytosine/adenosine deaminase-related metal-dependent hydrolase
VITEDDGKILAIGTEQMLGVSDAEVLKGIICPGFINTHCHLELSHLKGKIATGTGLVNFIKGVQGLRQATPEEVLAAAQAADEEMYRNGIVAVGDIANGAATASIKANSKLYYHTFVEVLGFAPERAAQAFAQGQSVMAAFFGQPCSMVPHAPYTVSKDLFKLIRESQDGKATIVSIHNQESEEENKFFRYKKGDFVDLYRHFNVDISFFKPQARNSLQTIIQLFNSTQNILLVHNTFTNLKDIYFIKRFDRRVNWCFCPNANLYIEQVLPKVELFYSQGFNLTLGTDSLASNHQLCILSELKVLQQYFAKIDLAEMVKWATLNGATFLGINHRVGSIEPGKTPGLNLITHTDGLSLSPQSQVQRLI